MKMLVLAAVVAALPLAACTTTADQSAFEQIGYGPSFDYAKAHCGLHAGSAERGYFAFGSPSYVAGAQLGNAIGNAIRVEQFMQQCMVLQGWKRKSTQQAKASTSTSTPTRQAKASTPTATRKARVHAVTGETYY
jgi:hypothetical protein